MKRFFNWLADKISPRSKSPQVKIDPTRNAASRVSQATHKKQAVPRSQPEYVEFDSSVDGKIDDAGPGKNVLRRRNAQRDENDSLSILDEDAAEDSRDDGGIDPYNTGQFDRSKNWDKRFRKD